MYASLKKIILVFSISICACYLIYSATDQQYGTAITDYNKTLNSALSLSQIIPTARPLNWEDSFIDAVTNARRLFTTISLYWEHDKRTLPARSRASKQIMNLMAIPGQPKATDAVMLLAQHEKILAQLEAQTSNLLSSRSAMQRAVNDLKLLFQGMVQDINIKLGTAQRNLTAAETSNPALNADANYQQAKKSFDEAIKLVDCLDQCIFATDPAGCVKSCRAKYGI